MSKGLQALHDLYDTMPIAFMETNSVKYFDIIVKELKALEIIRKKELNIYFVKRMSLEDFNFQCQYKQQLTQEEYNLLKEVLK